MVTGGLSGPLMVTGDLGATSPNPLDDLTGPGGFIDDHVERGKALLVTQFRQLRDDL